MGAHAARGGSEAGARPVVTQAHDAPGRVVRVIRVVPDVSGLRRAFDYTVPAELDDQVRVGTSVRVVLHNRRVTGWVVADDVEPPAGVRVQPIVAVRGWGPPPAAIALAEWAAWRWAGPTARLLGTASAPTLVRSLPSVAASASSSPRGAPQGPAWVSEALRGGVTVVRLAPAHDPIDLVVAAARLGLSGAAHRAGEVSHRACSCLPPRRRPRPVWRAVCVLPVSPWPSCLRNGLRPEPAVASRWGRAPRLSRPCPRSAPPWCSTPTTRPMWRSARPRGRHGAW